jgi:hypothetical protein
MAGWLRIINCKECERKRSWFILRSDWENAGTLWVRIAGLRVEIWTWDLRSANHSTENHRLQNCEIICKGQMESTDVRGWRRKVNWKVQGRGVSGLFESSIPTFVWRGLKKTTITPRSAFRTEIRNGHNRPETSENAWANLLVVASVSHLISPDDWDTGGLAYVGSYPVTPQITIQ